MKMTIEVWSALFSALHVDIDRMNKTIENCKYLIETSQTEKDKVSMLKSLERWQDHLTESEQAREYLRNNMPH